MDKKLLKFPAGFLWGASSSAHQCEGGNHNNWTEWEKQNAERLARQAFKVAKVSPIWREIQPQATSPANYLSGRGADHYNRYEEDFDLARSLNMNTARISIEWSRIEPEYGKINQAEIDHYKAVIKAIKQRGMEPFVTLWHWTLPLWVSDGGGWENVQTVDHFAHYTRIMVDALGKDVQFWLTLNEPEVFTDFSYRRGLWPPQKRGIKTAYRVARNLIAGHVKAYHAIKELEPSAWVGVSKNNIDFDVRRHWLVDYLIRNVAEAIWNGYFLNQISKYQDFIGLNHYFRYKHKHRNDIRLDRPHVYYSDMGWELHPESIYFVLKNLKRYNKPIYITENGVADMKDNFRGWFIENTLRQVHRAISEGVDVKGYLHWSLTDNFEWDSGFWPRFGLIGIDYPTGKRTVRESAKTYGQIIAQNGVTDA